MTVKYLDKSLFSSWVNGRTHR